LRNPSPATLTHCTHCEQIATIIGRNGAAGYNAQAFILRERPGGRKQLTCLVTTGVSAPPARVNAALEFSKSQQIRWTLSARIATMDAACWVLFLSTTTNGKGFAMGDKGGKKDKDKSQKQKAAKVATKQKSGKSPAK
jgi:hypothetical protein